MKKNKGIFLVIVIGILFMISLATVGLVYILNARIKQHQRGIDRSVAYYLCETGLSFAQLDFSNGTLPLNEEKTCQFEMSGKTYDINYKVRKLEGGDYEFEASVNSPFGLGRVYRLTMRGSRGFPFFIRGKP